MSKERYEPGFDYLDNYSIWSSVNWSIDCLKFKMVRYKQKVNEAHTVKERLDWMKEIMQLVGWGFEPNF